MKRVLLLHRNKLVVLADQAIVSAGNFLVGVLLARQLGIAGYGVFSILWMGVLLLLSLHQAFMTQPMMTLAARFRGRFEVRYRQGVFYLQILITVGLLLLTALITWVVREWEGLPKWSGFLPHTGLAATCYLLHDYFRKTWFIRGKVGVPLWMDSALYAVLFAALVFYEATVGVALLGYAAGSLASLFVGALFFFRYPDALRGIQEHWDLKIQKTAKEHYHYSIWLLGTSVLQWTAGNVFLVAAASLLGSVAVGAVRMAQNMVGLSHVLFLAMENIVPAEVARRFFTHGRKRMERYLWQVGLLMSVPFAGLLVTLSVLAPLLIQWLYGPEYLPYNQLVSGFAVLYLFVFIGYPLRFALRTLSLTMPIFKAYGISALVSLVLAYPLVGWLGVEGVVIGLLVGQLITLGVYVYHLKRAPATHSTPDAAKASKATVKSASQLSGKLA